MESIKKKICIGLQRREEWGEKLKEVLLGIVVALGIQLSDDELARVGAIPDEVSNLIYAGMLVSFVIEFAGETCELVLEYFPRQDEQDDLDLSLLDVVDWEVDRLTLRILVEDLSYAGEITGPALMSFSSDRLTVQVEQAGGGESTISGEEEEGTDADTAVEEADDVNQGEEESEGGDVNDTNDENDNDDVNDGGEDERKESEK